MIKRLKTRLARRLNRRAWLCRRYDRMRIRELTGASLGDYLQFPGVYDDMAKALGRGRALHRDEWDPRWKLVG